MICNILFVVNYYLFVLYIFLFIENNLSSLVKHWTTLRIQIILQVICRVVDLFVRNIYFLLFSRYSQMFVMFSVLFILYYYLFVMFKFFVRKNIFLFVLLKYLFPIAENNYLVLEMFLKYYANIGHCDLFKILI